MLEFFTVRNRIGHHRHERTNHVETAASAVRPGRSLAAPIPTPTTKKRMRIFPHPPSFGKSSRKFVYIDPRSTCTSGAEICTCGTLTRTRGHTTELNIAGSKRARATCASIRARFASIRAMAASSRADIASILAMPVWLRAIFVWKRATAVATRQDVVCSCAAVIFACVKNQSARPAAKASTGPVRLSIRSTT